MKQFLLSMLLVASASLISAQSFVITDGDGVDVTNGFISVNGDNGSFSIVETHVKVTNVSAFDIDVKVKRYEISTVTNSENYFCWYLCYASMVAGTKPVFPTAADGAFYHYRTIEADSSDNALSMYHKPEGTIGTSLYRYVIFDGNNAGDSVYVDVEFNVGYVGIEEVKEVQAFHYPNPASSNLKIKLDKNYNNLSVSIVDMLGKKVGSIPVNGDVVNVNVTDYKNGIYFYSIMNDKGVLLTRKFIVSK